MDDENICSFYDVWIGWLDDPKFSWDGGDWNGNVPSPQSPLFPDGFEAFFTLMHRIRNGTYSGKQTDWNGWVMPATKAQIGAFINEFYAGREEYSESYPYPEFRRALLELLAFVAGLDENREYALVACALD